MRKIFFLMMSLFFGLSVFAQERAVGVKIYNPDANAKQDIKNAVAKAKKGNKHVFLQIGGNWCVWCLRFDKLVKEDTGLDSVLNANYEIVHVNYSKENKNLDVLKSLDFPQRFGFPVFVILDAKGKRIHTQNSAYLEGGEGHSKEKVLEFFKNWTPEAIHSATYK